MHQDVVTMSVHPIIALLTLAVNQMSRSTLNDEQIFFVEIMSHSYLFNERGEKLCDIILEEQCHHL